jgi:hypothetical protein
LNATLFQETSLILPPKTLTLYFSQKDNNAIKGKSSNHTSWCLTFLCISKQKSAIRTANLFWWYWALSQDFKLT